MRITRHQMFMDFAEAAAKRSTCYRGNVGALITMGNDPVSMGYNGAAAGEEHCTGNLCPLYPETGGCMKAVHAERNAITRALVKLRIHALAGVHLYCTAAPCVSCAAMIEKNCIETVFYRHPYRDPNGLQELLKNKYRKVYRLTASGYLINERTGVIEDA